MDKYTHTQYQTMSISMFFRLSILILILKRNFFEYTHTHTQTSRILKPFEYEYVMEEIGRNRASCTVVSRFRLLCELENRKLELLSAEN